MTFEDFVAGHGRSLVRLAFVLSGDRHLAEDLTQTALADAYRHWRKVQAVQSREAYVRRMLINAHLSLRRRRSTTGLLPLRAVTFQVHEWFKGGDANSAVVDMTQPSTTAKGIDETVPSYQVGTRLLVSGMPRWGGAPLDEAIARGCGFTRYYGPERAAEWAAATR